MEDVITRLEAVAGRLEQAQRRLEPGSVSNAPTAAHLEGKAFAHGAAGIETDRNPRASSNQGPSATASSDFSTNVLPLVQTFQDTGAVIGGKVAEISGIVLQAFEAEAHIVGMMGGCQKPSDAGLQKLLQPLAKAINQAAQLANELRSDTSNHCKAASEALQALCWVCYAGPNCGLSPPPQHVQDTWASAEFYSNKVLKDFRNAELPHADWTKHLKNCIMSLQKFVSMHFFNGPVWQANGPTIENYQLHGQGKTDADTGAGSTVASSAPRKPPGKPKAPPPPPPGTLQQKAKAAASQDTGVGMQAVFSAINAKGEGVTQGLRKVTDSMKTKNMANRTGLVSGPTKQVQISRSSPAGQEPSQKPRLECVQGKKWVVEYQLGNNDILIEDADAKQTVYVYKCAQSTIQGMALDCDQTPTNDLLDEPLDRHQSVIILAFNVLKVKGKVNAIVMDTCKKTAVVFSDLVASCELINCTSTQIQATGFVPSIIVDKCDSVQIFLSEASLNATITTAKSSAINVLAPDGPSGDMKEQYIPEQFVSKFANGVLVTAAAEHGGG